MNSRISLILAGLLLVGALIAGYWGLVLSRSAPVAPPVTPSPEVAQPAAEDQTRQPVVVLAHDVAPFVALTAADLTLERLRTVPAGSLTRLDQAVGKTPWRPLPAGTWLTEESFNAGGTLARMIRPSERALAVAVDEVIGAGGQLTPGDYVDVLLFLRQEASNPQQSAQVVVPALRLLGVGDQLGLTNDGNPASTPPATADEKLKQQQGRASARTVTLAVPEQLLSRLMLATQSGVLRLAVRSADEQLLSQYWAGDTESAINLENTKRDLYQFNQLSFSQAPLNSFGPTPANGAPKRSGVEVIRGNQVTQQTP
ncbi:Flp pilus assembly protein CpaB [Pseudomonas sp. Bout1]|uniref:Flp pilus assembly protein CpaB n=1 Tax=Pseudomonas sp. Bout1 TaxID=3048600 RepID=UPI002AB349B9|nr:Flp pilus assembly protein CpaB [Pseudomonas sp. Bout1]MDY7530698.1 Flp pilus assembly protein CpaB [Pseudomonas sp. Bout1]MEB0188666.1 Flp pilus assembly protein CpaB [Pseudomonas sp. Bout1]